MIYGRLIIFAHNHVYRAIPLGKRREVYANIDFADTTYCITRPFSYGNGGIMKNIILTFALVNLIWTSALLYGFMSGKIERPQSEANYLDSMRER
jgi:hypothetical protein